MNPVKTLCFTFSLVALLAAGAVAQTRTVYFYPPDDAKWIAGRSYISNGQTATALTLDPATGCGWYKATFSGGTNPPSYSQFWLGIGGVDRVAPKGKLSTDFDDTTQFKAEAGAFQLAQKFTQLNTSNIYFVADELDPDDPNSGWYSGTAPNVEDPSRCTFNLAAFIYDTDKSVNPSFTQTDDDINAGGDQWGKWTSGILKGMVKPTLNAQKQIECDRCTGRPGAFNTTAEFENAFKTYAKGDKNAKNVKLCYDMPFEQVANGSFEFDSDKMRNHNNKIVGGFFPEVLDNESMGNAAVVSGASDYSDCSACRTKRTAESFVNLTKKINPWCFERGFQTNSATGTTMSSCGAAYGEVRDPDGGALGHFAHGSWPKDTWGMTVASNQNNNGQDADWRWSWRDSTINLWGNGGANCGKARANESDPAPCKANELFCFESHAEFIYDPEQEFFFRGDDDIWVYIDNKLVIDLGGSHLAAPGYVQLNKLGLKEGNTYPIDIFFCDRRTTMSNIRVSTNMYVTQKSNFYNDPATLTQTMCADISGGADCASKMGMSGATGTKMCGEALIRGNYTVEFFMLARGNTKDTIWLTPTPTAAGHLANPECTGSSVNDFQCYKGIKVDNAVYSCGGRGQCKGNQAASDKVQITGNYNVWVRLVNSSGQQMGKLQIDNIKSQVNTRIVWGTLVTWDGKETVLKDAFGETTTREQTIIAGKRTPIHITSGAWESESNFTKFAFDEEEAGGIGYSITVSGGTGLKIYENETGNTQKLSGTLPANGVETLWIEGGYDLGERDFYLNVGPEKDDAPSLKISLRQPTLRFVENSTSEASINSSGYAKWSSDGKAPFVGAALDVYLVAWDPVHNTFCSHCEFELGETSSTNNPGTNLFGDRIVQSDASTIKDGRANIYINGADVVNGSDFAKWKVYGPSEEFTFAEWTGLQFRIAPVPMPRVSYIYDRNGDGIGDSIRVEFNKSFKDGNNVVDSALLVLLEVEWEKGKVVSIYNKEVGTVEQLKDKNWVMNQYKNGWNNGFFSKNSSFWKPFVKDTNVIEVALSDLAFSSDVLTSGYNSGKGRVSSFTPFFDPDACQPGRPCPDAAFQYTSEGNAAAVLDRIPPVVVKAEYTYVANNKANCMDDRVGCQERLVVQLSEPVFKEPDAEDILVKNPFSYCFGRSQQSDCPVSKIDSLDRHSQGWDNLNWEWELPGEPNYSSVVLYKPKANSANMKEYTPNASGGDSIVELTYRAQKLDGDRTTRMPKSDDWIKIRPVPPANGGVIVFRDAEGNTANPRERGVLITGTNPSRKRQVKIAEVIAHPDSSVFGGIFESVDNLPPWINPNIIEEIKKGGNKELFKDGNVAEFLPVPKERSHPDTIKAYYPGSVGTLFDIADNLHSQVGKFVDETCTSGSGAPMCKIKLGNGETRPLTKENIAEGITLHASAYYHTNLGDYTAHRSPVDVKCTDKIFQNYGGGGDCYSNEYNFYLAWDLKTNAGRFVGAGAYVAISKFYWQIDYIDANDSPKSVKLGKDEFIEMYGVRRKGAKKGTASGE